MSRDLNWYEANKVTSAPDGPAKEEFARLAQSIRDWHPDFNIGDTVQRRVLGGGGRGTVRGFGWRGTHLMATVDFGNRCETFAASEYTR